MSRLKAFVGETLVYGFANVFSRVFSFALIPLYSRYLGREDYSNVVMLQSVFSVLTFVLALNSGVFFYYYDWKKERLRKNIFTSWFYYQFFSGIALAATLFLLSGWMKDFFVQTSSNSRDLEVSVALLGLQFLPYVFNITNINFYRIQRKPNRVVLIVFLEALFTLMLVSLALLYFKAGLTGVVLSLIGARLLVSLAFARVARYYTDWRNFSPLVLKRLVSFSWPFFIISSFTWGIGSLDKFIGAQALASKEDVALLALATQLTTPIAILADMIRMAIGPFVMSIKEEKDADVSYQQTFDLSVFSALIVLVGILSFSPIVVLLLTDESYLRVIQLLPLIGLASVLSLASNQFSISLSLVKKNVYILGAVVVGGTVGAVLNVVYMPIYGFMVSGVAQVASLLIISTLMYSFGRRVADLKISPVNGMKYLATTGLLVGWIFLNVDSILSGGYGWLLLAGSLTCVALGLVYRSTLR